MPETTFTKKQKQLFPFIKSFSKEFGLVGGTAIAFHIGHRRSIDFDLFSIKEFANAQIRKKIVKNIMIEMTWLCNGFMI